MKSIIQLASLLVFCLFVSCNNQGLNDEQRRQLKSEKQNRKIQRVSEVDILKAGKKYAIQLLASNDPTRTRKVFLANSVKTEYERALQEAYLYAIGNDLPVSENIEDIGDNILIYTKPFLSADSVVGFWLVEVDRKEVIISLQ